ncbi:unnamed protein product [Sphagnum compactum]
MAEEGACKPCPEISTYTHFQTNEKAFWAYVKLHGNGSPRWTSSRNNKNLQEILSSIGLKEPVRNMKGGTGPPDCPPKCGYGCDSCTYLDQQCCCPCLCDSSSPQCGPVDCSPGLHTPYEGFYPDCKDSHLPVARRVVEHDDLYLPPCHSPNPCSYVDLGHCSSPLPRCPPPAPPKLCLCPKPSACLSDVYLPSPRPHTPAGSEWSFRFSSLAISEHDDLHLPCSKPLTPMSVEPVDFYLPSSTRTPQTSFRVYCPSPPLSCFPPPRACADNSLRGGHQNRADADCDAEISPDCKQFAKETSIGCMSDSRMSPRCIDCECHKVASPLCPPILQSSPCSPCLPFRFPLAAELLTGEVNCGDQPSASSPKCPILSPQQVECECPNSTGSWKFSVCSTKNNSPDCTSPRCRDCKCHTSKGSWKSSVCSTQINSPDCKSPRCRDCECHQRGNSVHILDSSVVLGRIESQSTSPRTPCLSDINLPHYNTYFKPLRDQEPIEQYNPACDGATGLERSCSPLRCASPQTPPRKQRSKSFEMYSTKALELKPQPEDFTSWNPSESAQDVTSRCCCGMNKCTNTGFITITCPFCSSVHSCCCGMCSCPIPNCSSKSPILEPDAVNPLPCSPENTGALKLPNYSSPKPLSSVGPRLSPIRDVLVKNATRSLSPYPKAKSPNAKAPSEDPHPRGQQNAFYKYLKSQYRQKLQVQHRVERSPQRASPAQKSEILLHPPSRPLSQLRAVLNSKPTRGHNETILAVKPHGRKKNKLSGSQTYPPTELLQGFAPQGMWDSSPCQPESSSAALLDCHCSRCD